MKTFVLVLVVLLTSSCVSLYQNYNYTFEPYGGDLCYVSAYFWGSLGDDDFEDRSRATAQVMAMRVAREHGVTGQVLRVGKPQPFEGGGIYVGVWIGSRTGVSTMSNSELNDLIPSGARQSGKGKLEKKVEKMPPQPATFMRTNSPMALHAKHSVSVRKGLVCTRRSLADW